MNDSNSSVHIVKISTINAISNIFGYFIIPGLSAIGMVLNLLITILLGKNKFKHKFYKYLCCKTIIDVMICFNGIGFMNSYCSICQENISNTFLLQIYRQHLVKNSLRVLLSISSLFEVFLSLNRFMTILNKKNIFSDIRTSILMTVIFLICFTLFIPYLILITIQEHKKKYIIVYNFSNPFAIFHSLIVGCVEFIIPLFSVFVLNILIHKSYQKRIKDRTVKPIRKVKFIKIVVLLGTLYLIVRSCDFFVSIIKRLCYFFKMNKEYSDYSESWINLIRQISFSMLYLSLSLNVIIYFLFDKNIYGHIKRYLNKVKISFNNLLTILFPY